MANDDDPIDFPVSEAAGMLVAWNGIHAPTVARGIATALRNAGNVNAAETWERIADAAGTG